MKPSEAASIISALAESLRSEPDQFAISVIVVGQQITSQGGTGLLLNVTGGLGGATIGQQVSASAGSASIEQGVASKAVQARLEEIAAGLDEIAGALNAQTPNAVHIQARAKALSAKWLPGVVQSVVANVLTMAFGSA